MSDLDERADRLEEIKDEIAELVCEARELLRDTAEESRAKGYWVGHIVCALDRNHGYLGSSMVTMQDTINALRGVDDEDEAA